LPTQSRRRALICYAVAVAGATVERSLVLDRLSTPFALAAVVILALGLSACGRNGTPELPPGPAAQATPGSPAASLSGSPAAAPSPTAAAASPDASAAAATPQSVVAKTGFDAEGNPAAASGQKKPFFLDPLLH